MAIFVPRFVRQLRDVLLTAPADGEVLTYDSADGKWKNEAGGGGGGDLTDAVIRAPASSARNVIQPTDPDAIGLTIRAPVGSFEAETWILLIEDEFGNIRTRIDSVGDYDIRLNDDVDFPGAFKIGAGAHGNVIFVSQELGHLFRLFVGKKLSVVDSTNLVELFAIDEATGDVTVGGDLVVVTTDTRLTDARTPTAHGHAGEDIISGTVADAQIASTIARDSEVAAGYQPLDSDLTAIAALVDPNADRILFWDDSVGAYTFLTAGTGMTITGTTIDAAGGGGVAYPRKYKSGLYYQTNQEPSADASMTPVKDRVIYHAFPVGEALTIDRISCGVPVLGTATSVVRLGIYNDTDGQPDTLLLDAGTVAGDSTGYKEITISQALSAGTLYWIAVVWQVAAVGTLRASGTGAGTPWVGQSGITTDPRICSYNQDGVTGALPGTATPATASASAAPASVKVRAA